MCVILCLVRTDCTRPPLRQASYALGDADYVAAEAEDGWAARLLAALDLQLRWLQPRLTPGAWEGLFHSLLDKLLARLEVCPCVAPRACVPSLTRSRALMHNPAACCG